MFSRSVFTNFQAVTTRSLVEYFFHIKEICFIFNTRKIFNTILEQKEEYMSFLFTGYPNYRKVEDIHIDEKYYNFPIYLYHKNELSCSFNSRLIKEGIKSSGKKISSLQADALMYFEGLLHNDDLRVPIKLQPGEIIICNNYDIIHYRDSFKDSSTQERLLLRGWFNLHNQRDVL